MSKSAWAASSATATVTPATAALGSGGGGSSASRTTVTTTTASLAPGAVATATITLAKLADLLSVAASTPAWVRIYSSAAALTADASRASNVYPSPGGGCIADVITSAAVSSVWMDPVAKFSSPADVSTTYLSITNLDTVARAITVTLIHYPYEV